MFYLLRRALRQIFTNNWVSLWALSFSFTVANVPVEAQYLQDRTIKATVPVNNLANLEAALNIIANGAEIAGLIFGLVLICHSAFFGKSQWVIPVLKLKLNRYSQFFLGVGLIIVGLAIPGIINWSVASTRCGTLY